MGMSRLKFFCDINKRASLFIRNLRVLYHCEKNNSTIPNLGKVFPILGREILHKSSLNQSNRILEAALQSELNTGIFLINFGKILPRIGSMLWVNPIFLKLYMLSQNLAMMLWSFVKELPNIGTNNLGFHCSYNSPFNSE